MASFIEHGSIDAHIKDNVLYLEGCGPWNLEAVQEAFDKFSPLIETLRGSPWGAISMLHGDSIFVPDAANFLVKTIRNERKNGHVATAILVVESNSPEFAKRHLSELHTKADDTFRFFDCKEEAAWWLLQNITSAQLA